MLHHLGGEVADVRPFVSTLSRESPMHITLIDLSRDREGAVLEEIEEEAGLRPGADCRARSRRRL